MYSFGRKRKCTVYLYSITQQAVKQVGLWFHRPPVLSLRAIPNCADHGAVEW